jgi:hypothetical protein
MVSEEDQIDHIIKLMNDEKAAHKKWGDIVGVIIVGAGLGYMAFGSIWSALLFGWVLYAICGAKNSVEYLILRKETQRAVAYFTGDFDKLQQRLKIEKQL